MPYKRLLFGETRAAYLFLPVYGEKVPAGG